MHEMAVVTHIIDAICDTAAAERATRIVSCTLTVGAVRDIHEELLQRYFDWFSRGTAAEGVQVVVNKVPLRYRCSSCGRIYSYDMRTGCIADPWGNDFESSDTTHRHDNQLGIACECADEHAEETIAKPHCFDHPDAPVDVVSGLELFIEDIVVI